jgi:hypothetical protein
MEPRLVSGLWPNRYMPVHVHSKVSVRGWGICPPPPSQTLDIIFQIESDVTDSSHIAVSRHATTNTLYTTL